MGIYLNPGTDGFVKTINSEIYIDKTGLLNYTNRVINTLQGYICVSRPRRFGKTMGMSMLAHFLIYVPITGGYSMVLKLSTMKHCAVHG